MPFNNRHHHNCPRHQACPSPIVHQGGGNPPEAEGRGQAEWKTPAMFDTVLSAAIVTLEAVGAAVIVGAAGAAVVLILVGLAQRHRLFWNAPRRTLGHGLVLGLDFLIGADILRTMVAPTLDEASVLGVIIALRTILSLTIEFELRRMGREAQGEDR